MDEPLVHTRKSQVEIVLLDEDEVPEIKEHTDKPPFAHTAAFFIFGLINNIIYVIFLSAAGDLLRAQQDVSEGVILLADIVPAFMVKLCFPYVQHLVPYNIRVIVCCALSAAALLMVASFSELYMRIIGILLASLSSGLGEMTFLAMITLYSPRVLVGWGSGTGAAGLFGALMYMFMTTVLMVSMETTLLLSCVLPAFMLATYFYLQLSDRRTKVPNTQREASRLSFPEKLGVIKKLLVPYMLPLFLVYWAEYTINQGVSPNLLFPLNETPFSQLRDHYVVYQCLYQLGVFISRSSVNVFPIKRIWLPSLLQVLTLGFLLLAAFVPFIPSVWLIFVIILWEGLLGGATYVNAFDRINREVEGDRREFSMAAATLADTLGITMAAVTSIVISPLICKFQVGHGRDLCLKVKD